tara:strand:+ start:288 stop:512 length:225 start_codon:yes stop_codon:yes gene_type:complete
MEISRWNNIMKSFQDLMGWNKGITEVIVTKRLAFGKKGIEEIVGREEKYLVHILRKRYREINEQIMDREASKTE